VQASLTSSILVIENQEVEARGLKSALLSRGYTHVYYSLSLDDAHERIREKRFEIVVIGRTLGERDGISLLIELRKNLPSAVIVMLSQETPWSLAEEVQVSGGNALLSKSIPLPTLTRALVDLVAHPERFIFIGDRVASERMDELTLSERQILTQLSSGLTTKEIAKLRHNSEATIKSHLTSIYRKLGVRNRVEAIALLYR
jgi:DNA-binding NarL/FixJ family response regulator